jgi:hypothetical protein
MRLTHVVAAGALAVSTLAIPTVAIAGPAGATASVAAPCVKGSVTATPATVKAGATETVKGTLTNCSSAAHTYLVRARATGPAGTSCAASIGGQRKVTLAAHQTVTRSRSFKAPACAGTYHIVARVYTAGGTLLGTSRASFTVTP